MYAIYGNIYHQYTPNVSIYTSTMDPMGNSNYITSMGFMFHQLHERPESPSVTPRPWHYCGSVPSPSRRPTHEKNMFKWALKMAITPKIIQNCNFINGELPFK